MKNRTSLPIRLLPALCLLPFFAGCGDTIVGDDGGTKCSCLGPKGKLEFGYPPDSRCVTPLTKNVTGMPGELLVHTCVTSNIGANTKPYSLVGHTFMSTNDKLVLGGYDGSCGENCITLNWFNAVGSSDIVVAKNGTEVDRVTLTLKAQ